MHLKKTGLLFLLLLLPICHTISSNSYSKRHTRLRKKSITEYRSRKKATVEEAEEGQVIKTVFIAAITAVIVSSILIVTEIQGIKSSRENRSGSTNLNKGPNSTSTTSSMQSPIFEKVNNIKENNKVVNAGNNIAIHLIPSTTQGDKKTLQLRINKKFVRNQLKSVLMKKNGQPRRRTSNAGFIITVAEDSDIQIKLTPQELALSELIKQQSNPQDDFLALKLKFFRKENGEAVRKNNTGNLLKLDITLKEYKKARFSTSKQNRITKFKEVFLVSFADQDQYIVDYIKKKEEARGAILKKLAEQKTTHCYKCHKEYLSSDNTQCKNTINGKVCNTPKPTTKCMICIDEIASKLYDPHNGEYAFCDYPCHKGHIGCKDCLLTKDDNNRMKFVFDSSCPICRTKVPSKYNPTRDYGNTQNPEYNERNFDDLITSQDDVIVLQE